MKVLVRDLMTSPAYAVVSETGFREIVSFMERTRVSAVPVVDADGCVLGVVSQADLLLKEERLDLERHHLLERAARRRARSKAEGRTAADLMTAPAITIGPEADVREAARTMHQRNVKRLPVVDADGRLAGVISRGDVLRVFLRDDDELRREIVEDVIVGQLWLDPTPVDVHVSDGVVVLSGELDRRSDVEILAHLAGTVQGVVDVRTDGLRFRYDDRAQARTVV